MNQMWLLATYTQIMDIVEAYWMYVKHELRSWLGPEPLTYWLLEDGRVLPSTITLPDEYKSTTHVYNPTTKQITLLTEPNPEGRFRPLPFLGMTFGELDLSDWIGEIRTNPVIPNISPKQILQLWSYTHNTFLPKHGTICVIQSDGTEEKVEYA